MQRSELPNSDEEIVKIVARIWEFAAQSIDYLDVGGTFAFRLLNQSGEKAFLKIYLKSKPSHVVENITPVLLQRNYSVLDRLRTKYNLSQIPMITKTSDGGYFHEENDLILILSSYFEGGHASSNEEITGTSSKQLAYIFTQLHSLSASEFPEIDHERFNIDYALGLEKWININNVANIKDDGIRKKISAMRESLYRGVETLKHYQAKFSNLPMEFVLTHGDAHFCNVLINESEIFLIDWDNIKIGPRERDIWFYERASVINDYLESNPNIKINHDLCLYYQIQRILENFRATIEENSLNGFLHQCDWLERYERINK